MPAPGSSPIKTVGIVGGGVIGSGWAARCLAAGLDVIVSDPAPNAETATRASVANAWPALTRIGLKPGAASEAPDLRQERGGSRARNPTSCRRARPSASTSSASSMRRSMPMRGRT